VRISTSDVVAVDFVASPSAARNDFRGDGLSDILVKNQTTGGVYAGSGHSPALHRRLWSVGERAAPAGRKSSAADWRAGSMDFVGGGPDWAFLGSAQFTGDEDCESLWLNLKDGRPYLYFDQWANLFAVAPSAIEGRNPLASGDFDGDGKDDLLWLDSASGELHVDAALAGPASSVLCVLPYDSDVKFVEDFNGDGKDDLLVVDQSTGAARVLLVNGRRVVGGGTPLSAPSADWEPAGVGEFSGDGKADILWRNTLTGGVYIDTDLQDGLVPVDHAVPVDGRSLSIAGVGDYDGDGYADVLFADPDGRQILVVYMNGLEPRESAVIPVTDDPEWSLVR
jgi:hypothetical protein